MINDQISLGLEPEFPHLPFQEIQSTLSCLEVEQQGTISPNTYTAKIFLLMMKKLQQITGVCSMFIVCKVVLCTFEIITFYPYRSLPKVT